MRCLTGPPALSPSSPSVPPPPREGKPRTETRSLLTRFDNDMCQLLKERTAI